MLLTWQLYPSSIIRTAHCWSSSFRCGCLWTKLMNSSSALFTTFSLNKSCSVMPPAYSVAASAVGAAMRTMCPSARKYFTIAFVRYVLPIPPAPSITQKPPPCAMRLFIMVNALSNSLFHVGDSRTWRNSLASLALSVGSPYMRYSLLSSVFTSSGFSSPSCSIVRLVLSVMKS